MPHFSEYGVEGRDRFLGGADDLWTNGAMKTQMQAKKPASLAGGRSHITELRQKFSETIFDK